MTADQINALLARTAADTYAWYVAHPTTPRPVCWLCAAVREQRRVFASPAVASIDEVITHIEHDLRRARAARAREQRYRTI